MVGKVIGQLPGNVERIEGEDAGKFEWRIDLNHLLRHVGYHHAFCITVLTFSLDGKQRKQERITTNWKRSHCCTVAEQSVTILRQWWSHHGTDHYTRRDRVYRVFSPAQNGWIYCLVEMKNLCQQRTRLGSESRRHLPLSQNSLSHSTFETQPILSSLDRSETENQEIFSPRPWYVCTVSKKMDHFRLFLLLSIAFVQQY